MQVDWFWQVLCEATVETRLRILTWTTGLARAPLGGCLCCNMGVSTAHTRTHTHTHTHTQVDRPVCALQLCTSYIVNPLWKQGGLRTCTLPLPYNATWPRKTSTGKHKI